MDTEQAFEHAARLTSICRVDCGQRSDGPKYSASIWYSEIGEEVHGMGDTVWKAVCAAHRARKDAEKRLKMEG